MINCPKLKSKMLFKFWHRCNHKIIIIIKIIEFITPKSFLTPLIIFIPCSHSPILPPDMHWYTFCDCWSVHIFLEFYINGMIEYIFSLTDVFQSAFNFLESSLLFIFFNWWLLLLYGHNFLTTHLLIDIWMFQLFSKNMY